MKRNKRTEVVRDERLKPLTEHILAGMGSRGSIIRERLRRLYQQRAIREAATGDKEEENSL